MEPVNEKWCSYKKVCACFVLHWNINFSAGLCCKFAFFFLFYSWLFPRTKSIGNYLISFFVSYVPTKTKTIEPVPNLSWWYFFKFSTVILLISLIAVSGSVGEFWWFLLFCLNTKKMRDVRTIVLAAVSRRDLCCVCQKTKVSAFEKIHNFVRNLVRSLPS